MTVASPQLVPLTPGLPGHLRFLTPDLCPGQLAGDLNTGVSAGICSLTSPSVHKDKAFVVAPRQCTRLSSDFQNRLCFSCQSNGGQRCFISDSMMKSVETVLNMIYLPDLAFISHLSQQDWLGHLGISLVSNAR